MTEYKQVILLRKDLKISRGKTASQVAHASSEAVLKSHKDDISKWRNAGMKKAVLEVFSKEDLFKFKQQAEDAGLVTSLITDAGRTELEPGTVTCLAIGPDQEAKIDKITGDLKLLS
jgi:PTH2 family peptidyl-tRNA hydrolase